MTIPPVRVPPSSGVAAESASLASVAPVFPAPRPPRKLPLSLLIAPSIVVVLLVADFIWVKSRTLDSIEARSIDIDTILTATRQHLLLVVLATLMILVIAVPLGILLSRRGARFLTPMVMALANVGQAFPAIGLLTLLTMKLSTGVPTALIAFVAYGVLPILRNTMVGLQQIDRSLIEAAKGIGMRTRQILTKVELPLAVPVMLAGVRTTLVLTVGVATLATFIGAGGLGGIIVTGLKTDRVVILYTGAALTIALALLIDWLGRIAEHVLRPKGL
jgi:osmoprotectant transport system permease protein